MNRSFFHAAVVSILLYRCTTWTLTNGLPSRKLSKLDEPDMQDTAGEAGTRSSVMYSYGPLYMARQKQDDQLEHTYSSYVRIRDVARKTCQKRWTIGRSGERWSWYDDERYKSTYCLQWINCRLNYIRMKITLIFHLIRYIYQNYRKFSWNSMHHIYSEKLSWATIATSRWLRNLLQPDGLLV